MAHRRIWGWNCSATPRAPDRSRGFMQAEVQRWGRLVRDAGILPD